MYLNGLLLAALLFAACTFSMAGANLFVQARCLELGYSRHSVTITYRGYCITRGDDGADHVVPLGDLR